MELRKVKSGDDLVIPATAYNAFVDAANAHRKGAGATTGATPLKGYSGDVVLVKNISGEAIPRFGAVALSDPIVKPDDNLLEFQNRVTFQAYKPIGYEDSRWGVMLEPLPDGGIGQCVVSGVCVCQIDLADQSDKYVSTKEDSFVPVSGISGAPILWVNGDVGSAAATGVQWAVIRLDEGPTVQWGKVVSVGNCGASAVVNRSTADGEVISEEPIDVITGIPDSQQPWGLMLEVDDVIAYLPVGDKNIQLNPYKVVGVGYVCSGTGGHGDVRRFEFHDLDFNIAMNAGLSDCTDGEDAPINNIAQVEFLGLRWSWYGAPGDCVAKRVVMGTTTPPAADARHAVAFTGSCGTSSVTTGACTVNVPTVTITGYVPAVKGSGCNGEGVTDGGVLKEIEFQDGFKTTYTGGDTQKLSVELNLQDSEYAKITGGSLCALKVEICYEEVEVVTGVSCVNGEVVATTQTIKALASCGTA